MMSSRWSSVRNFTQLHPNAAMIYAGSVQDLKHKTIDEKLQNLLVIKKSSNDLIEDWSLKQKLLEIILRWILGTWNSWINETPALLSIPEVPAWGRVSVLINHWLDVKDEERFSGYATKPCFCPVPDFL